MDSDGQNARKLTERAGTCPSWSPDGRRIVFESWVGENSDIYVIDADGRNEQLLTNFFGDDCDPDLHSGGFAHPVLPAGRFIIKWGELKKF